MAISCRQFALRCAIGPTSEALSTLRSAMDGARVHVHASPASRSNAGTNDRRLEDTRVRDSSAGVGDTSLPSPRSLGVPENRRPATVQRMDVPNLWLIQAARAPRPVLSLGCHWISSRGGFDTTSRPVGTGAECPKPSGAVHSGPKLNGNRWHNGAWRSRPGGRPWQPRAAPRRALPPVACARGRRWVIVPRAR